MAAAAAEETADVNARPFIARRRLGASRDGAGALRAWLARTRGGRICACAGVYVWVSICLGSGCVAAGAWPARSRDPGQGSEGGFLDVDSSEHSCFQDDS